jgi:hypothetical protein
MQSIPQEILDRITSNLNITDTVKACAAKPNVSIEDRVDPTRYLRQAFTHPDYLMTCMTDVGCVISGSRALEYFEPGSIAETSDWDFYIYPDMISLLYMMSALEYSGVAWDIDTDKFARLVGGDVGHTEIIAVHELYRAFRYMAHDEELNAMEDMPEGSTDDKVERRLIEYLYREHRKMTRIGTGRLHMRAIGAIKVTRITVQHRGEAMDDAFGVSPGESLDRAGRGCYGPNQELVGTVLCGRTADEKGNQPVQLMICSPGIGRTRYHHETPMQRITSFYASHVQCFIAGWCAVQLFPAETSKKRAYIWKYPGEDPTVTPAMEKYEARGYEFVSYDGVYEFPARRISIQNGGALFVSFQATYEKMVGDKFDVPSLFKKLTAGMGMLSWYMGINGRPTLCTDEELSALQRDMYTSEDTLKTEYISDIFVKEHVDSPHIKGNMGKIKRMLKSGIADVPVLRRRYPYLL